MVTAETRGCAVSKVTILPLYKTRSKRRMSLYLG
jgi:hypothetical protein